jgi:hypothetical protein
MGGKARLCFGVKSAEIEFMILLTQGKRPVESPFDLLGSDENAITGAIAWTLRQSPALLKALVGGLAGYTGGVDEARLYFQRSEREKGRTDLEIVVPDEVHLILEAKKGWELPTSRQLELYTQRKSFAESRAKVRMIVTLSQADQRYAGLFLPPMVSRLPVRHLSRQDFVGTLARATAATSGLHEKQSLRTLAEYLNKTMNKPNLQSNQVYVVSLNRKLPTPSWTGTTFIDVVERYQRYFHPVGARWPVNPPNYIAFRYGGVLKAIHHIDEAVVTKDLADVAPGKLPPCPVAHPHFLYSLGPAIHPNCRVPAGGKVLRSNRVWAALDLLLTASSITEAMLESKKRRET